jgi:hypothetical protein
VRLGRVGRRQVAGVLADLDVSAGWRSTIGERKMSGSAIESGPGISEILELLRLLTYSCLTPTVQHCAGGLEAMFKKIGTVELGRARFSN